MLERFLRGRGRVPNQESPKRKPPKETFRDRKERFCTGIRSLCEDEYETLDGGEAILALDPEKVPKLLYWPPQKSFSARIDTGQIPKRLRDFFALEDNSEEIEIAFGVWNRPPLTDFEGGSNSNDLVHIKGESNIVMVIKDKGGHIRSLTIGSSYAEWEPGSIARSIERKQIGKGKIKDGLEKSSVAQDIALGLEMVNLAKDLAPRREITMTA